MPENVKTDNFETFLVEHGFITQALYDRVKQQSVAAKQSVINMLAAQKILDNETMAQARAAFLNIPYLGFKDRKVDDALLAIIPKDTISFYHFFSFLI